MGLDLKYRDHLKTLAIRILIVKLPLNLLIKVDDLL
jgi:hypothetical protein